MKINDTQWKILTAYLKQNPTSSLQDWLDYYKALTQCLDIKSKG